MKIFPIVKFANKKGDRLWWQRCAFEGQDNVELKVTIPLGFTIAERLHDGLANIKVYKFFFFSLVIGFGVELKEKAE